MDGAATSKRESCVLSAESGVKALFSRVPVSLRRLRSLD